MNNYSYTLFILLLLLFPIGSKSQLLVTNSSQANILAQQLVGPGVTVSNAVLNCGTDGAGTFDLGLTTNLGIGKGIVLTTGTATDANANGVTQPWCAGGFLFGTCLGYGYLEVDNGAGADANLNTIASPTLNRCALEFDVFPLGDSLSFNYVFASEEYTEYTCSPFNDVFAFFLSGANPSGGNYVNQNIATIPGTTLPVSINTVNSGSGTGGFSNSGCTSLAYSSLFVNNTGSTIAYDGFTRVLRAKARVVPCTTYRLKLAIADVTDEFLDSGVFLEAGSLSSPTTAQVKDATVQGGFADAIEGCVNGQISFRINAPLPTPTIIKYVIGGTATNGVDYVAIPDSIIIPAGDTVGSVQISPIQDLVQEPTETVKLFLFGQCATQPYDSAVIRIIDSVIIIASPSTSICIGDTAQLSVTGASNVSWTPATSLTNANILNPRAFPTATTTYEVTANIGLCISEASTTVTVGSANAGPDINVNCYLTDNATMAASGTGSWTAVGGNPGTFIVTNSNNPSTTITNFSTNGTYRFVWSTSLTCSDTVNVFVGNNCGCLNPPTLTLPIPKLASICYDQNQTVSVSFGGSATSVSALSTGTGSFNSSSSSVSPFNFTYTPSASDIAAGSVRLIFNTNNPLGTPCVIATDTFVLTITAKPNAGTDQSICQFTSSTLAATGVGTWTALSTNPAVVTLANASTPNTAVGPFATAGNYNFVWTSNGCTDTVGIEIRPVPAVVINNQNLCIGQSYVTAAGNVQTSSGIYYDTIPSLNNCDSVIQTNLNFYGTLIQASSDVDICIGDTTLLTATGGTTYSWTPTTGLSYANIPNPQAYPTSTTTYIVNSNSFGPNQLLNSDFEAGNTGFSSAYTYATDVTPEGTYYITPNPQIPHSGFLPCPDHTTGSGNMMVVNGSGTPGTTVWQQTISVNPGTDYAFGCWGQSVVGGSPAILQFEINGVVLGAPFALNTATCLWEQFYTIWNSGASTTATITILNQNTTVGGNDFALDDILFAPVCYGSDTVTVTVHNPANTIIDTAICQGQSYTLPNGTQVNTSGPYQHIAQTVWGCDSIIDINLTVKPQPVITASNDTLLNCTVIAVTLSASSSEASTNFTWTGGATGSTLTVNTPNTYTVSGTADGCTSSDVVVVSIDTLQPTVNAGVDRILTCSDTLFELIATTTSADVSFIWSNAATTANTTITTPNTYTVTAIDTTNGCSSTDAVVVTQNITPPSVSLGPNRTLTCSVLSINLTPQTNTTISDYEWSTTAQTPTINVASPDVYSVTVTSAINGCTGSATILIDEASRPQAFFNAGDNPCIDVSKGYIETNVVGGVSPFEFTWSNGSNFSSIYGIKGGNYMINIEDANGCRIDTTISIVNGEFLIDAYDSKTINLGEEAQLFTAVSGGSGSYDLVWTPQRYLDCYTCDKVVSGALQTLTYTVYATDTNGCKAQDTVTVTVVPDYPLYIPNAFTPNNDGFNDFFEIFGNKKIWLTMNIKIFNRWGELVFETSDQQFRWDGRYKGELLTPQVLTYVLNIDYVNGAKESIQKGSITLIR